jgi:DNA-binding response OmpR family regulator
MPRLLLVDDYVEVADALSRLFTTYGHECRTAACGEAALAAAREFDPDIMIVDLDLPDFSGCEVARRWRAETRRQPFMTAMTGRSDTDRRKESLAAGFDHHVIKPIDTGLARRILQLYDHSSRKR